VRHLGYYTGRTEMSESTEHRDPLYLFICYLEWRIKGNLAAYHELVAALDDGDCAIRNLSEVLLHRHSPRPDTKSKSRISVNNRSPHVQRQSR